MPPNLVAARAGYAARHGGNIASKRHANFSQAIHIFFSSEKNVNRLRKNHMFQTNAYFIGYQQNNTILKKNKAIWTWEWSLRKKKRRRRRGQGHMGPDEEHAGKIQSKGYEALPYAKKGAFPLDEEA